MMNSIMKRYMLIISSNIISMSVFLFAFTFPISPILSLIFLIVLNVGYVIWKERCQRDEQLKKIFPIVFLLLCVVIVPFFTEGCHAYYNYMTLSYQSSSDYTFPQYTLHASPSLLNFIMLLMFVTVAMGQLLLIDVVWHRRKSLLLFILTLIPFVPTLFYGLPQPWLFTSLLFALWFYLLCTSLALHHNKQATIYVKPLIYILTVVEIITMVFLVVMPESRYEETLAAANMRQKLLQTVDDFFYSIAYGDADIGEIDLAKAGDRYYTGAIQLRVDLKQPESLYLKTYSGSIYTYGNNIWESLNEGQYTANQQIDWERIPVWLSSRKYSKLSYTRHVKIEDNRTVKDYAVVPYGIVYTASSEIAAYYDLYYTYFDQGDASLEVSDFVIGEAEPIVSVDEAKKDVYYDFVKKNYTEIDEDIKALFDRMELNEESQFLVETELDGLETDQEAVINYIINYLHDTTEYTLKPGNTPHGVDFIDYFLNENKKGYCVHYATAATMLLRYYGIPARYSEGFYVSDQLYQDGIADVPDKAAHAWVEIFDPNKGWTPIEVTPASGDNMITQNPTEEPKEQPEETPSNNENETPNEVDTNTPQDTNVDDKHNDQALSFKLPIYAQYSLWIILICLLPYIQRKLRYMIRYIKMHRRNRRKAVQAMDHYLKKTSIYGIEVPDSLHLLYNKALFSRNGLTKEEFKQYCKEVTVCINQGMKKMDKKTKRRFCYFRAYR